MEAIEAGFVADFGPAVLLAPPAEGFNLVAYLLPVFMMVTAGMLVGLIVKGGVRREDLVPVTDLTDEEEDRLRLEMQKLDEAESPDW
jgi:cytochrome c-type biogenesis protein CcmH/NrfF